MRKIFSILMVCILLVLLIISCAPASTVTLPPSTVYVTVSPTSTTLSTSNTSTTSTTTITNAHPTTTTTSLSNVIYPANGATNIPVSGITFTWPAYTGSKPVYYMFELSEANTTPSGDQLSLLDYSDNTLTNKEPIQETLQYNSTYWWKVSAIYVNCGGRNCGELLTMQMFTTTSH